MEVGVCCLPRGQVGIEGRGSYLQAFFQPLHNNLRINAAANSSSEVKLLDLAPDLESRHQDLLIVHYCAFQFSNWGHQQL
jgi:hypothetical protein